MIPDVLNTCFEAQLEAAMHRSSLTRQARIYKVLIFVFHHVRWSLSAYNLGRVLYNVRLFWILHSGSSADAVVDASSPCNFFFIEVLQIKFGSL